MLQTNMKVNPDDPAPGESAKLLESKIIELAPVNSAGNGEISQTRAANTVQFM